MIQCQRAVTAMSVNATAPVQLAIGCSDSTVRLFDRRMLGTKNTGENMNRLIILISLLCSKYFGHVHNWVCICSRHEFQTSGAIMRIHCAVIQASIPHHFTLFLSWRRRNPCELFFRWFISLQPQGKCRFLFCIVFNSKCWSEYNRKLVRFSLVDNFDISCKYLHWLLLPELKRFDLQYWMKSSVVSCFREKKAPSLSHHLLFAGVGN